MGPISKGANQFVKALAGTVNEHAKSAVNKYAKPAASALAKALPKQVIDAFGISFEDPAKNLAKLAQAKKIGHQSLLDKHRTQLENAPNHEALGKSRMELATLRMGKEGLENLSIIQAPTKAEFFPVLQRIYEDVPTKVKYKGEIRLLDTMKNHEIQDMMLGVDNFRVLKDGSALTLAENRVIQDYIGKEGFSREINQHMRGDEVKYGRMPNEQAQEYGLLLTSALNGLPPAPGLGVHCLSSESPMYKAIIEAAEKGEPFYLKSFLSISQCTDFASATPNENFGDAKIYVISKLAKDVTDISCKYDQEKEAIIPPYEGFSVIVKEPSKGKPAEILLVSLLQDPSEKQAA